MVMKMKDSIWMQNTQLPEFPNLRGNKSTDVLIIGGGITGLLCAWQLQQVGVDYLLIEADRICSWTSGHTTAKITSQHGFVYDQILRRYSVDIAKGYYDANQAALDAYRRMCNTVDCDFEIKDNYVYTVDSPQKLERELKTLQLLGIDAQYAQELPLPLRTHGAIRFPDQAQLHPLKFLAAIARNLKILEHTAARAIDGNVVLTDYGRITAEKIVVATHFPPINKCGFYFVKQYQNRSYVISLANGPQLNGMYRDEADDGFSFRNYGSSLILGGGAHRTGKGTSGWSALEKTAQHWYPTSRLQYRWAAQDCMTLDAIPYIGKYNRRSHELYVATGFNKWGMTSAMVASMILCDSLQGKINPYAEVFSPQRSSLHPQLAVNMVESIINLLKPTAPRCSHLGCVLKWNPYEHSWDCPCHGSRFDEDGKLLENPAKKDLKTRL